MKTIKDFTIAQRGGNSLQRCKDLRRERLANRPIKGYVAEIKKAMIPLSDGDKCRAAKAARELYPRRQNWDTPEPSEATAIRESCGGHYRGRYSSYAITIYKIQVQSWGIANRWALYARIDGEVFRLRAPRGYAWKTDENGIALYRVARPGDDYHPDSNDVRLGARHCAARLRALADLRREEDRKVRADARLLLGLPPVYICVRDSLRAGNCETGTRNWAKRHNFNARSHVRAEIIEHFGYEDPRVARAIEAAKKRHIAECQRGYAILAEHV